jgi:hypothetical protein
MGVDEIADSRWKTSIRIVAVPVRPPLKMKGRLGCKPLRNGFKQILAFAYG